MQRAFQCTRIWLCLSWDVTVELYIHGGKCVADSRKRRFDHWRGRNQHSVRVAVRDFSGRDCDAGNKHMQRRSGQDLRPRYYEVG